MEVSCIFCKIIQGFIPTLFVYQDDKVVVINDLHPKAPVHYLIIPKKHIACLSQATSNDQDILGYSLLIATYLSKQSANQESFRLLLNNGANAGQSVFHIHFHFLAGKVMTGF